MATDGCTQSTGTTTARARPWQRWALVLLVLLATSVLALRWYLSSRQAANRVEAHLTRLLGADVRLEGVEIGLSHGTILSGLDVREPGEEQAAPWLQVRDARIDAAVLNLVGVGNPPRRVDLNQAVLELRFDENNKLLTRMPRPGAGGASPLLLTLTDSRLILKQRGRPQPFQIGGLRAELHPGDHGWVLTGTIDDPEWGQWRIDGTFDPKTRATEVHLKTRADLRLDRGRLEQLPFVAAKVWRQVRIDEAVSPVDFNLRFGLDHPGLRYRLEMAMRDTRLHVSSIDLDADHASGLVVIEDKFVRLLNVNGRSAGGHIHTEAELDFRQPVSRLKFDIDVKNADLHRLPRKWHLPDQVNGQLTGHADLSVVVGDGPTRTSGNGQGTVEKVKLLGLPFPRPIPIRMYTENDRIRFGLKMPAAAGAIRASFSGQ